MIVGQVPAVAVAVELEEVKMVARGLETTWRGGRAREGGRRLWMLVGGLRKILYACACRINEREEINTL